MPKEIVPFNSFNGAAPAIPDAPGGAVSFWNARVDGSLNTAVPENKDKAVGTAYIQQKNLFVEGKDIAVSEDINGHVYVDGVRVGTISPPTGDRPCMDVIGRQMSIIQDSGHTKYLRYGYSKGDLIGVDRNDIIFEEDVISSKYGYSTQENIQFAVPINERYILYAQYGFGNLYLYDIQENITYSSFSLAPSLPLAWSYDKVKIGNIWYPVHIYFAYYKGSSLFISKLNLSSVFQENGVYPEELLSISAGSDVILAHVKVMETNNPAGSKLDSIAVSKDYVFLAYNMGDNVYLNSLATEEDMLFSFSKNLFVYNQPAKVVSCAENTLNRSKLPFMPYRNIGCYCYWVETQHFITSSGYELGWNENGYEYRPNGEEAGYLRIPYEAVANSEPVSNTNGANSSIDTECGFLDLYLKLQELYLRDVSNDDEYVDYITGISQVTKIYSPGYCGFAYVDNGDLHSNAHLIGSLTILDYVNNIVGYEIACNAKTWLNSHLGCEFESLSQDIRHYSRPHYGCGMAYFQHISTFDSSSQSYVNSNIIWAMPLTPNTLYEGEEDVYFNSDVRAQDIYYCWNGQEPVNVWDYEFFDILLGSTHYRRYFHLTKFFNNPEVESDGSARFAVFASDLSSFPGSHKEQRTHYSLLANESKSILTPSKNNLVYFSPADVQYSNATNSALFYVPLLVGEITKEGTSIEEGQTTEKYKVFDLIHETIAFAFANNIVLYNVEELDPPNVDLSYVGELHFQEDILTFRDTIGTGFEHGTSVRYRIAFVYDGISISPLSDVVWDHTVPGTGTWNIEADLNINIAMLHLVSRRITAVRLYAVEMLNGVEQELYRLVGEKELNYDNFTFDSDTGLYKATIHDNGTRYASFNIDAGYSETVNNVSVRRNCQCVYNGIIYAGNVYFPLDPKVNVNTDNLVLRSLPYQPSIFNYQEEYCVLGFVPNVLIPYNGRIYAFGKEEYSIINADTLAIEYTSKSCGALQRSHVVATETGIFVYFNGNLYIVDGNKVVPIGEAIKENNYSQLSIEGTAFPSFKWLTGRVYVEYIQNRNAIAVIGEKVDAPGKYRQIIAFVYGISTGRWATYMIETPDAYDVANLKGVYSTEDGSAIVTVSTDIETLESPSIPILPPIIIPPETKAVSTIPGILVRTISYNNGRYLTTYAISQKLFGSDVSTYTSRVRTMELDYVTDFGIKNKKQIYDIQTYNGNTRVQSEIYIDNKKASEYYGKPVQKSVFHISIESQEPISVIRYVIRSFVTKEEN